MSVSMGEEEMCNLAPFHVEGYVGCVSLWLLNSGPGDDAIPAGGSLTSSSGG